MQPLINMNSRSDQIQHKLMKTNDTFKELFVIQSTSYIICGSASSRKADLQMKDDLENFNGLFWQGNLVDYVQ